MSSSDTSTLVNASRDPQTLDQAFQIVTTHLLETFLKKHKDYGKDNILAIEELGITMRILEKAQRLKNLLATQQDPANESIDDSFTDIAVYAIIGLLYRRGQFQDLDVDPELLKRF